MTDYKTEAVQQLAAEIKNAGFRVFIAKRGTHGFFTDTNGSRVVSFQYEPSGFKFSGNYKSDQPRSTGTGWDMGKAISANYNELFNSGAPRWAVGSAEWKFTTLAQYLATYQSSSVFTEFHANEGN